MTSTGWAPTLIALVGLFASLGVAVVRPAKVREVDVAVPFAVAVLALHGVALRAAGREARDLLPVVLFLVAVLVLAKVCAAEGLFEAIGDLARRRSNGEPRRLLLLVVGVASLTTAILSLDTTVVLLTPVVVAIVGRARVAAAPFLLVTVHLSNSASLLLPVSNLTNLLALEHSHLTFLLFAARMALPWFAAIAVEYAAVRIGYRTELPGRSRTPTAADPTVSGPDPDRTAAPLAIPRLALVVVLATLGGFAATGPLGVQPVWVAAAGAAALGVPALVRHRIGGREVLAAAGLDFAVFVVGISVIVLALAGGPLGRDLARILPTGSSWADLLLLAVIAAAVANAVNNLPATLLLLALLPAAGGVLPVLAVLIGVNVGPNLTYPGSLATLLWRRALPTTLRPTTREFILLGLVTVPVIVVAAVTLLWLPALVGR